MARVALAVLAALILVTLVLELHWSRLEAQGRGIVGAHDASRFPAAVRDFQRASAHEPGTEALLAQAELYLFVADNRRAIAPLTQAVSVEPENALAWRLLAQASDPSDPALSARASARAARLNPPVLPRP